MIFTVTDQGNGIPDEYKENIFSLFQRMDKQGVEGSGLGLAIVKKIVQFHNGKVWVEGNTRQKRGSKGLTYTVKQRAVFVVKLPKGHSTG